ncbi:hypothetical protein J7K44_00185 [bacterium]|nr:hypothetical protein [bacterium]
MISENEVIKKIQELKQIEPRKDWVVLTKKQILGEDHVSTGFIFRFFQNKLALASVSTVLSVLILFGIFTASQSALPGDLLYPIKKTGERIRLVFAPEEEKPVYQLQIVNNRLEELAKVAQTRQGKDLPLVYKEVEASVAQAAKTLTTEVRKPAKDSNLSKKIVAQVQKIEKKKEKVEQILATQVETKELDNAVRTLAAWLINDWENRTLNEKQKTVLKEAKELYKEGNYSQALELLLNNQ